MANLTRRSLLRGSLGFAAAGTLARPISPMRRPAPRRCGGSQGFAAGRGHRVQEDRRRLREGERQHDRLQHHPVRADAPEDHLGDDQRRRPGPVSEQPGRNHRAVRLERQTGRRHRRRRHAEGGVHRDRAALGYCYNSVEKKRSYYGVPYNQAVFTNHIWKSLVEKAGYKIEDIPKTWDAFYDFFKGVQKKLREQGVRNVYGLGFQVTTNGVDPNCTFQQFPDRLWRPGHRHQGRQAAPRRSARCTRRRSRR